MMMVICRQDDEISSTTEMVQKLQEQIAEQEDLIAAAQRERDQAQAESQRQQSLSESSMNEVKEVLQALEELALSYEQKTQEVLSKDKDNEALTEELTRKKVTNCPAVAQFCSAFAAVQFVTVPVYK